MTFTRRSKIALRAAVAVTLVFIYVPLIVVGIYAFNSSNIQSWPIAGFTTIGCSAGFAGAPAPVDVAGGFTTTGGTTVTGRAGSIWISCRAHH